MVNPQEWLDKNYPKDGTCKVKNETNYINNFGKKREEIKELDIYKAPENQKLIGSLNLTNFINLEYLNCYYHHLTDLDLSNCINLERLDCNNNILTNLTLTNCPKLKEIYCHFNNLAGDLTIFSGLVNLEYLDLNVNRLTGSLKPLQNCSKLIKLNIECTQITSGLEYLPASLERLYCDGKLAEELKDYKKKGSYTYGTLHYDYQIWRKDHPELIANAQKIMELEKTLSNLDLALIDHKTTNNLTSQVLTDFFFETEKSIKELRREIEELKSEKLQARQEIPPK